jgi:predicted RNA binding protein YcfA (HicA-like mRNA interferase family)
LLQRLSSGSFNNIRFSEFTDLAEGYGFTLDRTCGSHQMFRHPEIGAKLNLQPDGREAKPYQIRQFLRLVEQYGLQLEDEG